MDWVMWVCRRLDEWVRDKVLKILVIVGVIKMGSKKVVVLIVLELNVVILLFRIDFIGLVLGYVIDLLKLILMFFVIFIFWLFLLFLGFNCG